MQPHPFDTFARVLVRGQSRRDLGRLAVASVAGGLLAATGTGRVAADDGYGNEEDSCADHSCCAGVACSQNAVCFVPDEGIRACGSAGDACENLPCCNGLVCNGSLMCVAPDGNANLNQGTTNTGSGQGANQPRSTTTPAVEQKNPPQQTADQTAKPAAATNATAPAAAPAAGSGIPASWIDGDRKPWNTVGRAIPTAPRATAESGSCAPVVRAPETAGDRLLAAAG